MLVVCKSHQCCGFSAMCALLLLLPPSSRSKGLAKAVEGQNEGLCLETGKVSFGNSVVGFSAVV